MGSFVSRNKVGRDAAMGRSAFGRFLYRLFGWSAPSTDRDGDAPR